MKNPGADKVKKANKIHYSSKTFQKEDSRDRRRLEMKRRFGILQSRRNHLESELKAVKNSLIRLDQQIQSFSSYEQLVMNSEV